MKDFWVTYETRVCVRAKGKEDAWNKVLKWDEDYFYEGSHEIIGILKVEEGDE